jgi:hypothetical protein
VRLDGSSSAVSSAASQSGWRHVHGRLGLAPMHGRHVASGRWPLHGGVQGGDGSFPVTACAGPEERGRDPIDGGALFGGVILAPEVDAVVGRAEGPGSNGGSSQGPSVGFPSSSGGPGRSLESVGPVRPLEIVGPEIELHLGGSGVDSGDLRSTFVGGGVAPSPAAGATPVAAKAGMVPAADADMIPPSPTAGAPPVTKDAGMVPAADAGLVPPLPAADAADMAPAAVGPPSSFPAAASGGLPVAGSGEPSSSSTAPPVLTGGMKSLTMMLGPGTRIWPRSPITYSRKGRRVVASPVLSPVPAQPRFVERMSKAVDSILDDPPMRQRRPRNHAGGTLPRRSRRLAGAGVEPPSIPQRIPLGKLRIVKELGLLQTDHAELLSPGVLDDYAKVFEKRPSVLQLKSLALLLNMSIPEDLLGEPASGEI